MMEDVRLPRLSGARGSDKEDSDPCRGPLLSRSYLFHSKNSRLWLDGTIGRLF